MPEEKPPTVVIQQSIGELRDNAKATALEVGRHEGPLTLQVFGASPNQPRRFFAPPTARRIFVGREQERIRCATALASRRRVLVHGMAGIGKTALALAVAQRAHREETFRDGILWISEIGAASADLICDAVARRLGDPSIAGLPMDAKPDATRELLATYPGLLVILDHLDSQICAETVVNVMVPETVALLATSQWHYAIFDDDVRLSHLEVRDAVKLFQETAGSTASDAQAIEEICGLLDCHPLALVVGAARVRAEGMPLAHLKERLVSDTALNVLNVGERRDRNRSVWTSLQLSYDPLATDEQDLLNRLAACFDKSVGLELLALLSDRTKDQCEDLAGQLVMRSLVERSDERLSLQHLTRSFLRERMATRLPEFQEAALKAVRAFVNQHKGALPSHYDAIEAEVAHVIGAAGYARRQGDWAAVLELAKALGLPVSSALSVRGYWTELTALMRMGLEAAGAREDARALAYFKHNLASVLQVQGDFAKSRSLYEETLVLFREQQNARAIASALHNLGVIVQLQGDYRAARAFLEESRQIKQAPEHHPQLACTLHELGRMAAQQARFGEARSYFEECCTLDQRFQSDTGLAADWQELGVLEHAEGRLEAALEWFSRSQSPLQATEDKARLAELSRCRARLLIETGHLEEAYRLLQEGLDVSKALGAQPFRALVLYDLAVLETERLNFAEARRLIEQSLELGIRLGIPTVIAQGEYKLGELARRAADPETARDKLNAAWARFLQLEMPLGVADCLHELGLLIMDTDLARAAVVLDESLTIREQARHPLGIARSQYALGCLAQKQNALTEARARFQQSHDSLVTLHSPLATEVLRSLQSLPQP